MDSGHHIERNISVSEIEYNTDFYDGRDWHSLRAPLTREITAVNAR
jgi:hypothetical protein